MKHLLHFFFCSKAYLRENAMSGKDVIRAQHDRLVKKLL